MTMTVARTVLNAIVSSELNPLCKKQSDVIRILSLGTLQDYTAAVVYGKLKKVLKICMRLLYTYMDVSICSSYKCDGQGGW